MASDALMVKSAVRREALIDALADALLAVGLDGATLRPLAAAAGTSDRMLLYYFADKDALLTAVLVRIAERLTLALDAAQPASQPIAAGDLLAAVWRTLESPALAPFMPLWLELAARAARGAEPYRTIAGSIADGFHAWLTVRLGGDAAAAARLLATVDGMLLLAAVGRPALAERAITSPLPFA